MNRNIVSGFVENLFWILPLIAIVGLWNYILPIFVVLVISYILYIILDPLVCFIERLIGLRILSIMIVLSTIAFPLYLGGNYLYSTVTNNYEDIKNYMTKVVDASTVRSDEIIDYEETSLQTSTDTIINHKEIDINNSDETVDNHKEIDINTSDSKEVYKTRVLDLENLSSDIEKRILPLLPEFARESVKSFFKEFQGDENRKKITNVISQYFNFGNTIFLFSSIGSTVMFILITISFVIMLLANAQNFKKSFIKMVPNRYFEMSLKIIDRISDQISAYIRGTFMAATIVGILSIIALQTVCTVFGMPHKYIILVGVIAGVFNLIPFIGPMIGAFSGVLLFILSVDPVDPNNIESASFIIRYYHIIFIFAAFGAVQLIDNLLTSPLIISDSVGLHPMFVIIVVLIGGYALNILGMIIAVPFAAILKVIVEELTWGFRNYQFS